jgi:hypothetical protein
MNETTILEKRPNGNGQQESKKEGVAWKQVTLGGVSGILMGAGLLYGGQAVAQEHGKEAEKTEDVAIPEQGETSHTLENGLQVAAVNDDLSFGEAFAQARAEVGPGGVFHWHGGIYNTYTAAEWNAMSVEQKHDFAQQVKPEVSVDEISTPTDANTHVVVEHHVYHHEASHPANDVHQTAGTTDDVQIASQQSTGASDDDVHIVGYGSMDGHTAVALDIDNDGAADVAIIDINDNHDLDSQDVIVDSEGNWATVGDVIDAPDPNQLASMENPDVAPDMPDYMNDAMVDA